jgi:aryl-alcohol dehydrogenase-like predicted oxidoreductase
VTSPGLTHKLGLGTVQFGLDYGISNVTGKFPESAVRPLLDYAWNAGVRTLDTANAYGDSESVLGRSLNAQKSFAIVTKTVPLAVNAIASGELDVVERGLRSSLERLGTSAVYGILVHNADNLLCPGGTALFELLARWKQTGLVRKIGASVYDAAQLRRLMDAFPLDLVQLPLNVFDQRLIADGSLRTLKGQGVEVHVRSVFLQGLLLMQADELAPPMQRFAPQIAAYRRYLLEADCSPLEASLGFVKHLDDVDVALIGVNSQAQMQECLGAYDRAAPLDLTRFASDDLELLDPRRWSRQ